MSKPQEPSEHPEKAGLWEHWRHSSKWQDKLHNQAAHKALDIPDEPVISSNNTNTGFGWKEMAVAAVAGLGALGLYKMGDSPNTPATPPPAVEAPSAKINLYYDDPKQGLVPLAGAAGEGATLK